MKGRSHTDTATDCLAFLSSFAPLPWILSSVWVAVFIAENVLANFYFPESSALRVSMLVSSCLERRYRKLVSGTAISSAKGQGTR